MDKNQPEFSQRSKSESELVRNRSTARDSRRRSRSPASHRLSSQSYTEQTQTPGSSTSTLPRSLSHKSMRSTSRGQSNAKGEDKKKKFNPFRPLGHFAMRVFRQVAKITPVGKKWAMERDAAKAHAAAVASRMSSEQHSDKLCNVPTRLVVKLPPERLNTTLAGLRNHGNTCYINSIVQCLTNTDALAEYFCCDLYKKDVVRSNKLNARQYGTRGEITDMLAMVMKSLWAGQYAPELTTQFRTCIGKYGAQYRGSKQHDAQEFLTWLLDKIHEDLNTASKKKYRSNKSSLGRTDEIVAAEAMANHTRCNSSFVQDLFLAQYRSSLCCSNCLRKSNNFDPFLCVSLPIPQRLQRPVYVTIVYLDAHPKQVRIGVTINVSATIKELREELSLQTAIPVNQIILSELYYDGFHRTFNDYQSVSVIHETDNIFCIQTPPISSRKMLLICVNRSGSGSKGKKFGSPVVFAIDRQCSYHRLQSAMITKLLPGLRNGITTDQMGVLFKIRVADGIPGKSYLSHDVDLPLFVPTIDRALESCDNLGNPTHVKLYLEWDPVTKQTVFTSVEDVIEEHVTVRELKRKYQKPVTASLSECFDLYTQTEKLDDKNAWRCPNCKKGGPGTTKRLHLWTLPDILVIHLKRFQQLTSQGVKLNTLVEYPIYGLDMSKHVAPRTSTDNNHYNTWSPWKRTSHQKHAPSPDDFTYDLYGICNHIGTLTGGHYTAICRNPANSKWYLYDDQRVKSVSEEDAMNKSAYILFYQRRSMASSSVAGSSKHWVHHMPAFRYTPPSKSHSAGVLDDRRRIIESGAATLDRSFTRGTRKRMSLEGASSSATLDRSFSRASSAQRREKSSNSVASPCNRNSLAGAAESTI